jgi:HSP20 family protein
MPNVRYYNQTAPFWDWVANLEGQGLNHPAFGGNNNRDTEATESTDNNPWSQWPFQPFQQRGGRHGGPRGFHQGPPGPPPAPEENEHEHDEDDDPPISTPLEEEPEAGPSDARGPPPPPPGFPGHHHPHAHAHHGHGPPPHHARGGRRGRCGGGRGGPWGGRSPFVPSGGLPNGPPAFMQDLAAMFNESLFGGNANSNSNNESGEKDMTTSPTKSEDFTPEADVFDTPDAYVIHLSLPGAKKEDVGVNWDAEKSEINVAGVIYRPGDEEFLKSLALNERKVGAFERMIRLGSRANPAHVDVEGITAKLEDGILRVTVPKMNGEFVDVKRIDVE